VVEAYMGKTELRLPSAEPSGAGNGTP
jgi:hypothetical protein